jgi:hypothetical protein
MLHGTLLSACSRLSGVHQGVIRLWTEQKVTERTEFFSFEEATSQSAVAQSPHPHPPVWGAAIRSPESSLTRFCRTSESSERLLRARVGVASAGPEHWLRGLMPRGIMSSTGRV